MKVFSYFIQILLFLGSSYSLHAQSCSVTISGSQDWSTASWSCSGGASAPTTDGMLFVGDINITLNSNAVFTSDLNITIDGDIDFTTNGNTDFIVEAGTTLDVDGDFDASNENNIGIAVNGKMQVEGTLEVKNGNSFGGSGIVSGGDLVVKNNNTCGAGGCPTIAFATCTDGNNNFCDNNNPGGPLEISLENLHAAKVNGQLVLNWSVTSTHELTYHAIEGSQDGVEWQPFEHVDVSEWVPGFPSYHEATVANTTYAFFRVKTVNAMQEVAVSNVIHWSASSSDENTSGVDVIQEDGQISFTNHSQAQQIIQVISLSGELLWSHSIDAASTVQINKGRFQSPFLLVISPLEVHDAQVTKIFMH